MKLKVILFIALVIRLILLYINQNITYLPNGGVDEKYFDFLADKIMRSSPYTVKETLSSGTYLFATFGSWIYKIFGRNTFIWGLIMVFFGVGTIKNIYRGVIYLTNNQSRAVAASWFACFFPNLAVLSVLVLREAPVQFFLSYSILFLIKYFKFKKLKDILCFLFFSLLAAVLHTAIFGIIIAFFITYILYNRGIGMLPKIAMILVGVLGLYYVNSIGLGLSKFGGSFDNAFEQLSSYNIEHASGADYPSWLNLSGGGKDVLIFPFRYIAFLFAPLIPFMVRSIGQTVGLIDSLLFLYLFKKIYDGRKQLKQRNIYRNILIIFLISVSVFALGSSNFGTNIRHRAKLLPVLIMLGFSARIESKSLLNTKK